MQQEFILEKNDLEFHTSADVDGNDVTVITRIKVSNGKTPGYAIRAFHHLDNSITFINIVRGDVPSIIPHTPSLIRNGIPFSTFVTLLQSKVAEFDLSKLQKIRLIAVNDNQTLLALGMLMKRFPDTPINELITHTHSFDYTQTLCQQIGKEVQSIQVSNISDFQKACTAYNGKVSKENLIAHGLTPDDQIPSVIGEIIIHLK
ncbi:MAG TPA: hypothetical protein DCS93_38965 [Microscillaceae bacterium]|nr:hypothetical protein [Microscillaceae bacterium]